jgi:hypothetical protein
MPIDDDREFKDAIIEEMLNGGGISVNPVFIAIGHGFHPETGEDLITFGSHDYKSGHLLTQVMPLSMARDACANLATQIGLVDRLNAGKQQLPTKGTTK